MRTRAALAAAPDRFHTDAAQSIGKIPTRVDDLGVDLLTLVGHKVHAATGVGALFIRDGLPLDRSFTAPDMRAVAARAPKARC